MNKVRNISINVEYSKIYPYFLRMDLAQSHIWAKQIIFKKVNSDVYNVTLNGVRNYPCLLSFFSSYGIRQRADDNNNSIRRERER